LARLYKYPVSRPRRLRRISLIRDLVSQTRISTEGLIQPIFVYEGLSSPRIPIESMPDQYRYSVDGAVSFVGELLDAGIRAALVFGVPSDKDPMGKKAYSSDGPAQMAVRSIKKEYGDSVVVATDVCLCSYTDHGHCGVVIKGGGGYVVDNDETIKLLGRIAVSHAEAGADIVAPSAMMDGQVGAIRDALDSEGYSDVAIMSYSAKYASSLYGPFRVAASSKPLFGDRRGYQMDPRNLWEAVKEVEMDLAEGADIVMVKPGLWYLDVVRTIKESFPEVPLAVYSVSSEYLMIKAAASSGYLSEDEAILESLIAMRRAGADIIITYSALKASKILSRVSRR
jgi:porphobilinogen synthase